MLKVENVKVYDLKESVIASGFAMRTKLPEYTEEEFEKGLKRCRRLVQASNNSEHVKCHDNALTGIRVSFDVTYPQYWTPEFQRYHFADIVTSASKMHRLLKMNIDESCNKYVTTETKENLKQYINEYNAIDETSYKNKEEYENALYEAFMKVISNCPLGLELFMRISTNYKQLQTIYYQRRHHKLKEDWGAFCKAIEELPYFKELILGEE